MKDKSMIIQMNNPCDKDWNAMTPTEKGKFCAHCSKHVVDLAHASDDEIVRQMTGKSDFCGRFSPEQLNRPLIATNIPATHSFFSRICSVLFFIATSGSIAPAQTSKKTSIVLQENKKEEIERYAGEQPTCTATQATQTESAGNSVRADSLKNTVRGIICDHDNRPAGSAIVTIQNTTWKTVTDSSGYFEFTLPDSLMLRDRINFKVIGNKYDGVFAMEKQKYGLVEQYPVYRIYVAGGAIAVRVKPKYNWFQLKNAFTFFYFP